MIAALLLLSVAATPEGVTIERATIPWSELEKLLRHEGAVAPKPGPKAPLAHSISNLEVTGRINGTRAELDCSFEIEILAKSWVIVPIVPRNFAVASGKVIAPGRGILVRDANGVSLVAKGEGNYVVSMRLEGELDIEKQQAKLTLSPPGLMGGHASIAVAGKPQIAGRTRWRATTDAAETQTTLEAALGADGVDLTLEPPKTIAPLADAGAALEELRAVTVVSLGGRGVTRISVMAKPGANKIFEAALPESAKLFKAWIGREGVAPEKVQRGTAIKMPLERPARVELAYTFEATRLGVRGGWHVELPKLAVETQSATWDVWLPDGLDYRDTQSSMIVAPTCTLGQDAGITKIDSAGRCFGFSRPVLEPAVPYAEGSYRQRF